MFADKCATQYEMELETFQPIVESAKMACRRADQKASYYSKTHVKQIIEALSTKFADALPREAWLKTQK